MLIVSVYLESAGQTAVHFDRPGAPGHYFRPSMASLLRLAVVLNSMRRPGRVVFRPWLAGSPGYVAYVDPKVP